MHIQELSFLDFVYIFGHAWRRIFLDDTDLETFLATLAWVVARMREWRVGRILYNDLGDCKQTVEKYKGET